MKIVLVFLIAAITATNGQDVKGKIACEGTDLTVTCDKGEHLEIVGGNYGRTSADVCTRLAKTDCVSQWSLRHMKEKCNDHQSCTLSASNKEMGDPCRGVEKYLETYYKCVKEVKCSNSQYKCNNQLCIPKAKVCDGLRDCGEGEDEAGCKYAQITACEKTRLTINCKPGEIIRVVRGFYGRSSKTICGDSTVTNCSAAKANEIIKNKCNFQQSCTFMADNTQFTDPCGGINKYADVLYTCWTVPKMLAHFFDK